MTSLSRAPYTKPPNATRTIRARVSGHRATATTRKTDTDKRRGLSGLKPLTRTYKTNARPDARVGTADFHSRLSSHERWRQSNPPPTGTPTAEPKTTRASRMTARPLPVQRVHPP